MKNYLLILLLVAACQPIKNSSVSPVVDPRTGIANGSMNFNFESSFGSGTEYISARADDGELFKGNVVKSTSTTHGYEDVTTYYKENGKMKHRNESNMTTDTTYNSAAKAILIGNQGHSMECDFMMPDPEFGLASGGAIGTCKISDGRTVPLNVEAAPGKYGFRQGY